MVRLKTKTFVLFKYEMQTLYGRKNKCSRNTERSHPTAILWVDIGTKDNSRQDQNPWLATEWGRFVGHFGLPQKCFLQLGQSAGYWSQTATGSRTTRGRIKTSTQQKSTHVLVELSNTLRPERCPPGNGKDYYVCISQTISCILASVRQLNINKSFSVGKCFQNECKSCSQQ